MWIKVGLSPSKNIVLFFFDWKPFKNDFVTTYWSYRKNGLIKKISLTLKFKTSQTGLQTIAKGILPNISQRKGNQTMKFGQLIEYNKRNIFLQNFFEKA